MYARFEDDISRMNHTYDLRTVNHKDLMAAAKRLQQFEEILNKECGEIEDIFKLFDGTDTKNLSLLAQEARVMLADLLGDLIVYCASEAQRWEIDLGQVLQVIMASNFSKLGEDGKPIKNPKTDKFEKGPNYWKPEPIIRELLMEKLAAVDYDGQELWLLPANAALESVPHKPTPATDPSQSPQS